jgi:hypothetical protein
MPYRLPLLAITLALASLAACSPADETAPQPSAAVEATAAPELQLSPVETLTGEYRVAGVNGAPIDAPFGLALSITESRIVFDGPCGGYAWDYRLDGANLAPNRAVSPDPACLATARIHHLVFDLATAIDAATRAGRSPSNGIELSGSGQSVTLYSQ